jgi:protein arginine kinase activator
MKCQICRQKDANIVFTKIVNNEKMVLHICLECAKKKGLTVEIGPSEPIGQEQVQFPNQTDDFFSDKSPVPDLTCDRCGTTFAEFKKTGFFGCDRCHEVFGQYFMDILKHIHGATIHEGKSPLGLMNEGEMKKHLRTLRMRLKRCIDSEQYERAAELRDKIASLEGKLSNHEI